MSWKGTRTTPIAVAGTTVLANINVEEGAEVLWTEVVNLDGANRLDVFNLRIKSHPDSNWYTIASATADFTTAILLPLLYSSGDPTILAAASFMCFAVNVRGLSQIELIASADTGIVSTTARWKMR